MQVTKRNPSAAWRFSAIFLFCISFMEAQVDCVCDAQTTHVLPAGGTSDWVIANQLWNSTAETDGRCLKEGCNPPAAGPCGYSWRKTFDVVVLGTPPVPPTVDVDIAGVFINLPPAGLAGNVLSYVLAVTTTLACGDALSGTLRFSTGGILNFTSGNVSMTCSGC